MRLQQIQKPYLYEGLDRNSTNSMLLWESAGQRLKEAALTADQIQQLFAAVEKSATAQGDNRTMLGKGKDAAEAVNKAWENLKTKVQDSGPIKAVDQKYDDVVAKIEQGLGGPDGAVSKAIMKYRKFAKEHPIAQGLIYSALIAAAGISSAGLGGAAVLGLLKMTDKLLQGEKFSSAAYSGAKTGALAYGASKLGDYLKGKPEGDVPNADAAGAAASSGIKGSRGLADEAARIFKEKVAAGEINDYNSYQQGMQDALDQALQNAGGKMSFQTQQTAQMILRTKLDAVAARAAGGEFSGSGPEKVAAVIKGLGGTVDSDKMSQAINAANTLRKASAGESTVRSGKKLSEGQVYMIFNRVSTQMIMEGPLDTIKGLAAKGLQKAQTVGKNLTTKVTADKLNSAWQKAGSPTDSAKLVDFLQSQGVNTTVVDQVFKDLKIPTTAAPATPAGQLSLEQVRALIAKLPTDRKVRLVKYMQKQLKVA